LEIGNWLDRCNEAVTPTWQCLDEPRRRRLVAKCCADLTDAGIDGRIELDECSLRPQHLADVVASDQRASAIREQLKELNRLRRQMKTASRTAELAGPSLELEHSESQDFRLGHRHSLPGCWAA
jgi:hypothetical protein